MTYPYNKKRHKQLVKHSLDLKNQGKSLLFENRAEDFELSKYNSAVREQVYWAHREKFLKIIKNFLTGLINFDEFDDTFSELYNDVGREYNLFRNDLEKIEKFQPSTRPNSFASLMTCFFRMLDAAEDDYMTEQEVTSNIKEYCSTYQIFEDEVDI